MIRDMDCAVSSIVWVTSARVVVVSLRTIASTRRSLSDRARSAMSIGAAILFRRGAPAWGVAGRGECVIRSMYPLLQDNGNRGAGH
jgi:hypothetical protein